MSEQATEEVSMSTAPIPAAERRRFALPELQHREVWASLAITAIWVAVLFTSVFGSDIVTMSAGGDASRVPSGVVAMFFATIATFFVARYGLREHRD
jgi:hypothetical protein